MQTPRVVIRTAPDYERPAVAASAPSPSGDPRRPHGPGGQQRQRGRSGQSGAGARTAPPAAPHEGAQVRTFAIGALTVVFEALDGRRGFGQLSASVAPELLDRLTVLRRLGVRPHARELPVATGTATLRRVHVQMSGDGSARIFGSYTIGGRVRAFCGVTRRTPHKIPRPIDADVLTPARWEYRWQLVALDFC